VVANPHLPGQGPLINATMSPMSDATPLPRVGEVFFDERGDDRALRLSWHPDSSVMVLSIWNRGVCTGTFRLPARDIPALLEAMGQGLPPSQPRGRRHADHQEPVPSYELDTQLSAAVPGSAGSAGSDQDPRQEQFARPAASYDQPGPRGREYAGSDPTAYDVPAARPAPSRDRAPAPARAYDNAASYGGGQGGGQSSDQGSGYPERGYDGPPAAGPQYGTPYEPGTPQFPSTGQYEVGRRAPARPPAPQSPTPAALDVLKSLGSSSADEQPPFPRTGEYRRPPQG